VSWEIDSAPSTRPGDVIDAHVHLFTVGLLEEYLDKDPTANERFREALKQRRFGRRNDVLPEMSPEQTACWYVERLRSANVAKALVVSVIPDNQWTRDFLVAARGHVHALAAVDPREPDAPQQLEREMAAGFRGVKLMPVNRSYSLSDPACRPFFEKANEQIGRAHV